MSSLEKGRLKSGITFRWLAKGSSVAPCDRCHRRVFPNAARLQLHDGKGPVRKKGKGSRSSYLCTRCAYRYHLLEPPTTWTTTQETAAKPVQEGLFDE